MKTTVALLQFVISTSSSSAVDDDVKISSSVKANEGIYLEVFCEVYHEVYSTPSLEVRKLHSVSRSIDPLSDAMKMTSYCLCGAHIISLHHSKNNFCFFSQSGRFILD
jgi:hypothetical protein